MSEAVTCTADEMEALETIEDLARRLVANPKNLIQSGERNAIETYLAKLDAMRAIERAKETA
jgi:nitrate reductase beta subunit